MYIEFISTFFECTEKALAPLSNMKVMNYSSRENDSHPSHPIPSIPNSLSHYFHQVHPGMQWGNRTWHANNVDIIHTYIYTYIHTYIHMCYVCLQNLQLNKLLFFNIHIHTYTYICMCVLQNFANLVKNYYFSTNIIYRPTPKTVRYFTTIITILGRTKGVVVGPWPRPLKGQKKKRKKKKKRDPHVFDLRDLGFSRFYVRR